MKTKEYAMNEKFYSMYEEYGIVAEKRGRLYYYRYRTGIDSIYNRELTAEEVEKLQEGERRGKSLFRTTEHTAALNNI